MNTDIVGTTRALLSTVTDRSLVEIAEGSDVSYRWLIEFKAGRVKNPTLRTVQGLHAFLTKVPKLQTQPN
jgi:hypothetical protein